MCVLQTLGLSWRMLAITSVNTGGMRSAYAGPGHVRDGGGYNVQLIVHMSLTGSHDTPLCVCV